MRELLLLRRTRAWRSVLSWLVGAFEDGGVRRCSESIRAAITILLVTPVMSRRRGEFFAVVLCHLVPEVGVGRYDLIAGPALRETLKEGEALLVLTTYEALPLTANHGKPLVSVSVGS